MYGMFYAKLRYARNLKKESEFLNDTLKKLSASNEKRGRKRKHSIEVMEKHYDEMVDELHKLHVEIEDWLENSELPDDLKCACRKYYLDVISPYKFNMYFPYILNLERDIKRAIASM